MGNGSQRYPGVRQAVCIKAYKSPGLYFKADLLEIVTVKGQIALKQPDYKNEFRNIDLVDVQNSENTEWYFIKNKQNNLKYSPSIGFFDDHFKMIE